MGLNKGDGWGNLGRNGTKIRQPAARTTIGMLRLRREDLTVLPASLCMTEKWGWLSASLLVYPDRL